MIDAEYQDTEDFTQSAMDNPTQFAGLLDSILFVLQRSLKNDKNKQTGENAGEDDMMIEDGDGEEKEKDKEKEKEKEGGIEEELNTCSHGKLDPVCRTEFIIIIIIIIIIIDHYHHHF